jgi:hypothetical protein
VACFVADLVAFDDDACTERLGITAAAQAARADENDFILKADAVAEPDRRGIGGRAGGVRDGREQEGNEYGEYEEVDGMQLD